MYHRHLAIRKLQKEIEHFSSQNADIILAASMNLSNQSSDWYAWCTLFPTMIVYLYHDMSLYKVVADVQLGKNGYVTPLEFPRFVDHTQYQHFAPVHN